MFRLNYLSWNANSLAGKFIEFCEYVNNSGKEMYDLFCVQESRLKVVKSVPGYHTMLIGDMLVGVKEGRRFEVVNRVVEKEWNFGVLLIEGMYVVCCYLRNGGATTGIRAVMEYVEGAVMGGRKVIVMGDLNTMLPELNPGRSNTAGRWLHTYLRSVNCGMILWSDGTPTFCRENVNTSVIDVVMGSHAVGNIMVEVLELFDSDHKPIKAVVRSDGKLLGKIGRAHV